MSSLAGGYVSAVFLPDEAAAPLERAALDDRHALALLRGDYSANAYVWAQRYLNCNQWVAELLGMAWATRRPATTHAPGRRPGCAAPATRRTRSTCPSRR